MNQTCKTCRWWEPGGDEFASGWCHRYPPVPVAWVEEHADFSSDFPSTNPSDFCGEWQPLPIEPARTE